MQTLNDGTQVTSRSYYYLLDWNDWNGKKIMSKKFNKHKLRDLNFSEYQTLFNFVASQEFPIEPSTRDSVPMMVVEPLKVKTKHLGYAGVALHHLPITVINDMNEDTHLIKHFEKKTYDFAVVKNYEYVSKTKKSSRVRGKKNEEFKQSIRNLTNNQKK